MNINIFWCVFLNHTNFWLVIILGGPSSILVGPCFYLMDVSLAVVSHNFLATSSLYVCLGVYGPKSRKMGGKCLVWLGVMAHWTTDWAPWKSRTQRVDFSSAMWRFYVKVPSDHCWCSLLMYSSHSMTSSNGKKRHNILFISFIKVVWILLVCSLFKLES